VHKAEGSTESKETEHVGKRPSSEHNAKVHADVENLNFAGGWQSNSRHSRLCNAMVSLVQGSKLQETA
jgi:hypothetical protein